MKPGRYRWWGDQKPDTDRPILTFSRGVERAIEMLAPDAGGEIPTDPSPVTSTVATLRIYGPIDGWGGWWGVSANDVARALDQLDGVDTLIVRINSPGGDTFEGRAIMNLLRANSAHTIAVVDGWACSAASYVAVGCDETVMAPGTELMIHDTHTFVYGDAADLRKEADTIDSMSRSGSELYADVAGGTPAEWRALQVAETWFTASEAVEAGLADRVGIVPDSGPVETAAEDEDTVIVVEDPTGSDERADEPYDFSIFTYAGREQAPDPRAPKPPTASADGSITTQGTESAVAFSDEQLKTMRQELGLAEDADEATIVAAMSKALETKADTPASPTTQIPEGMALVDSALLTELQAGAAAGTTAQTTLRNQERDSVIDQALKDGKIAATSREKFVEAWDKDAVSTRSLLDALTPGVVPTSEVGHETAPGSIEDLGLLDSELDAFAESLGLTGKDLR